MTARLLVDLFQEMADYLCPLRGVIFKTEAGSLLIQTDIKQNNNRESIENKSQNDCKTSSRTTSGDGRLMEIIILSINPLWRLMEISG